MESSKELRKLALVEAVKAKMQMRKRGENLISFLIAMVLTWILILSAFCGGHRAAVPTNIYAPLRKSQYCDSKWIMKILHPFVYIQSLSVTFNFLNWLSLIFNIYVFKKQLHILMFNFHVHLLFGLPEVSNGLSCMPNLFSIIWDFMYVHWCCNISQKTCWCSSMRHLPLFSISFHCSDVQSWLKMHWTV